MGESLRKVVFGDIPFLPGKLSRVDNLRIYRLTGADGSFVRKAVNTVQEGTVFTVFLCGSDPVLYSLFFVRKYSSSMPQIEIIRIPHMMHGEFVIMHPEDFTRKALAFLE